MENNSTRNSIRHVPVPTELPKGVPLWQRKQSRRAPAAASTRQKPSFDDDSDDDSPAFQTPRAVGAVASVLGTVGRAAGDGVARIGTSIIGSVNTLKATNEVPLLQKVVMTGELSTRQERSYCAHLYTEGTSSGANLSSSGASLESDQFENFEAHVQHAGKHVTLDLWLAPDDEKVRSLTLIGADAVLILFSKCSLESFEYIYSTLAPELVAHVAKQPWVLIGARRWSLRSESEEVSDAQGKFLARALGAQYIDMDLDSKESIAEVFDTVVGAVAVTDARMLLQRKEFQESLLIGDRPSLWDLMSQHGMIQSPIDDRLRALANERMQKSTEQRRSTNLHKEIASVHKQFERQASLKGKQSVTAKSGAAHRRTSILDIITFGQGKNIKRRMSPVSVSEGGGGGTGAMIRKPSMGDGRARIHAAQTEQRGLGGAVKGFFGGFRRPLRRQSSAASSSGDLSEVEPK